MKGRDGRDVEIVPNEALRVDDIVDVLGWKRVCAIRPYRGPLAFIFALVDTVPGTGFSLERGGYITRVVSARGCALPPLSCAAQALHPNGACTCAQEGTCAWCTAPCLHGNKQQSCDTCLDAAVKL